MEGNHNSNDKCRLESRMKFKQVNVKIEISSDEDEGEDQVKELIDKHKNGDNEGEEANWMTTDTWNIEDEISVSSDDDSDIDGSARISQTDRPEQSSEYFNQQSNKHKNRESGKSLKCEDCNRSFGSDVSLYQHIMMVHCKQKAKGYRCSMCAAERGVWKHLTKHMHRQHGIQYSRMLPPTPSLEREGLLTILLKKEGTRREVDNVEMKLTERERYPCEKCYKAFPSRHSLTVHQERKHTQNEQEMSKKHALAAHELKNHTKITLKSHKIHTQNEKCSNCGKEFQTLRLLMLHVEEQHNGDVTFQCHLCGEKSKSKIGLAAHFISKHSGRKSCAKDTKKIWVCSICGRLGGGQKQLQGHMVMEHRVHHSSLLHPTPTDDGEAMTILVHQSKYRSSQKEERGTIKINSTRF